MGSDKSAKRLEVEAMRDALDDPRKLGEPASIRDAAPGYGQRMVPAHPDERPHGHAALLAAVVASLPAMQANGVRRLTVGVLTVELERVVSYPPDAPSGPDKAGEGEPNLDTYAVDG
ncbi:MAG TPA: hypothetical protein VK509_14765 [Polyangiales bacterium]|nr:hypothetical protein [Polyangiales bacterium]